MVQAMIDAGVKIIQYREKDKKMLDKYKECQKMRELTRQAGVTFIINDDVDSCTFGGCRWDSHRAGRSSHGESKRTGRGRR